MPENDLSATIPNTYPAPDAAAASAAPATPPAFLDLVPAELKEKPWVQNYAKNANPFEALFNGFESAQTLIGKKATGIEVPGADATPEAVKAFHKALGVPEAETGYEYAPPDITAEPEGVKKVLSEMAKDDSLLKAMKAEALKAGITPAQFKAMAASFDARQLDLVRASVTANEAANAAAVAQQTEKFSKIYGDKADVVKRVASETHKKVVSQAARDSGDVEIQLFDALNFIHEKLYKNDTVNTHSIAAPSDEMNADKLHAKIQSLRNPKTELGAAYADKFNKGHKAAKAQIDPMYEQLAELRKRG